jgi:multiple sugar transport system permease protein
MKISKETFQSSLFKKHIKGTVVGIFKGLFIIGMCYLFLFPILYMLITAFQDPNSVNDPSVVWIPKKVSLSAVKEAIEYLDFWKSAGLTLIITIGSTIVSIASCAITGYGLARFKFKGRSIVFFGVLMTIIIPPQILFSSSYLQYRFFDFGGLLSVFGVSINLLDSPWVFILPSVFACGLRNGIFIYIFYSSFKGLPIEIEEAAKIDGCGVFKTFISVMAPIAIPAFVTVLLFSIVWHWTDYYSSATYFLGNTKPIVVMLSGLESTLRNGFGVTGGVSSVQLRMYLQAGAMLTIAPPLILYIFAQKYFTESIERTGLVG